MRLGLSAMLIACLALGIAPGRTAHDLSRTHTVTMSFVDEASVPPRLTNAGAAFRLLGAFFDSTALQKGVDYSFDGDILHNAMRPDDGFVAAPNGFGYGANAAASLLKNLVVNTAFWDSDGIEKPLFQRVSEAILRGDSTYSVYGVNIGVGAGGTGDYVWHLNPAYDGPPPTITVQFDAIAKSAALGAHYADESTPPSRDLSLHDKAAILTRNLGAIIGDRRLGVVVIPIASPADAVAINADAQNPIASAWKGGGTQYFFENIDPVIWRSLPVQYWNTRNVVRVPKEYQAAFNQYNQILRWVYVMAVFSGNHEAGDVIDYVYRHSSWHSAANPIVAFNDWSQQSAGLSSESGLHRWQAGRLLIPGLVDHRRDHHTITVGEQIYPFDNTYSARDLAQYYVHLATVGRAHGYYDIVTELLSTHSAILSMLKDFSSDTGIVAASKIGYFAPDSPDSLGHDVNNDGGLLTLPDGEQFAVAVMAFDSVDIQGEVVSTISRTLINLYQRAPAPSAF